MGLLICLFAGTIVGVFFGGWKALGHARQHDFEKANKALRLGVIATGFVAVLLTTLMLGWPFKESSVSVPEEVTRTVKDTVEVVVKVPYWFFFTSTKIESQEIAKEITETVFHQEQVSEFSIWLLVPMMLVAIVAAWIYRFSIRTCWRWLG